MLQAFEQFLIHKEGVPTKNAPYYVKWVSDCYRFVDIPETQPLTSEQTAEYLGSLSKKHEDWQVQQADRALKLYDYFLSRDKEARTRLQPIARIAGKKLKRRCGKLSGFVTDHTARNRPICNGFVSFRASLTGSLTILWMEKIFRIFSVILPLKEKCLPQPRTRHYCQL